MFKGESAGRFFILVTNIKMLLELFTEQKLEQTMIVNGVDFYAQSVPSAMGICIIKFWRQIFLTRTGDPLNDVQTDVYSNVED